MIASKLDQFSSSSFIKVRVDGPAATVTIQRPEKRNALTRQMVRDLHEAIDAVHQVSAARAIVITGAGNNFSSGTDLLELHESSASENAQEEWFQDANTLRDLFEKMLRFPKPIIAAVNGAAFGTGFALVLASDIVIAEPTAMFALPEPRRGLVAGLATPLLVFRIGGGPGTKILLDCAPVDVNTAQQLGIVQELVEDNASWARATQIAKSLTSTAAEAISMTKRNLYEGIGEQLMIQLSAGAAAMAAARTTQAARIGVEAFVKKRTPDFEQDFE